MNQVKVHGRLVRAPYMGTGKSGAYAAGTLAVKDGKYEFWLGFYAPQSAGEVFRGAQLNELFEVEGSLVENKRKDQNGEEKRTIQVKADKARRLGAPDVPRANKSWDADTHITDDDIPF